jgi:hypothetical protein
VVVRALTCMQSCPQHSVLLLRLRDYTPVLRSKDMRCWHVVMVDEPPTPPVCVCPAVLCCADAGSVHSFSCKCSGMMNTRGGPAAGMSCMG